MERVRLFYNNLNIKPKKLLENYLIYLGFYVEEIVYGTRESDVESFADIWLIDDDYMSDQEFSFDPEKDEKAIIIFMGIWKMYNSRLPYVLNYDSDVSDEKFLKQITKMLLSIRENRYLDIDNLWFDADINKKDILSFCKLYCKYQIGPASLCAKNLYSGENIFRMASNRYIRFINQLENVTDLNKDFAVIKYSLLYAKYEYDLICKNNSYYLMYPVEELLKEADDLRMFYEDTEQIHILCAEILFHLKNDWTSAANIMLDGCLEECAYSHYRRGMVYYQYTKEYVKAKDELLLAVRYKKDYVKARYLLGVIYAYQGRYIKAVRELEKIIDILEPKFYRKIYNPGERKIMQTSLKILHLLYEDYLKNQDSTKRISRLEQRIQEQGSSNKFLELIWPEQDNELADDEPITMPKQYKYV